MTNTPGDDDINWEELELQFDQEPATPVVTVSVLDDMALLSRYRELTETLLKRKEGLHPTTQTGRDLHSERAACVVELKRRGLM